MRRIKRKKPSSGKSRTLIFETSYFHRKITVVTIIWKWSFLVERPRFSTIHCNKFSFSSLAYKWTKVSLCCCYFERPLITKRDTVLVCLCLRAYDQYVYETTKRCWTSADNEMFSFDVVPLLQIKQCEHGKWLKTWTKLRFIFGMNYYDTVDDLHFNLMWKTELPNKRMRLPTLFSTAGRRGSLHWQKRQNTRSGGNRLFILTNVYSTVTHLRGYETIIKYKQYTMQYPQWIWTRFPVYFALQLYQSCQKKKSWAIMPHAVRLSDGFQLVSSRALSRKWQTRRGDGFSEYDHKLRTKIPILSNKRNTFNR